VSHVLHLAGVRRVLFAGVAIAALACATPALATENVKIPKPLKGPVGLYVKVENNSSTCVWVSVAYATFITPWSWMTDPGNKARFIRPHQSYEFGAAFMSPVPFPHPLEAKVEGTFMEHADCSGGHAREITAVNKGIVTHGVTGHANAFLTGESAGAYKVDIYNGG
jgi:hypothetical protein